MPVGCPACLPAQEMTDDPPGELRVATVVVTGEALLRAFGSDDGREQSGR